ncbi:sensor histidine kinase [Aestuariibius sp. HNIBRBA575]|uniref:sensor histidine kinase n=1 Tax=Aestuariibius sp. HNIBRBA575 TaxID=3233343 RepID=UPI0034A2D099
MQGRISRKWRPSLALVLGMTLLAVLCLPLSGIFAVQAICLPAKGAAMSCGQAVLWVSMGILSITAILGYVLWRILLSPIRALTDRATRIKAGEAQALDPLAHYGTQEMREMGQTILDMGHVLQGREAVLRSYADHVTHELKSPLTVLRGAAELLDTPDLPPLERRKLLTRIDEAADRMTALLDAQRALAQAQEPFAAGSCRVSELIDPLRHEYADLDIVIDLDDAIPLAPDGVRLVLDHLIGNASDHGATRLHISATHDRLEVSDNGPGISDGNKKQIFDPYFTTRRDHGGTGMGLPIVRRMLAAHGAEISLATSQTGARFVILF